MFIHSPYLRTESVYNILHFGFHNFHFTFLLTKLQSQSGKVIPVHMETAITKKIVFVEKGNVPSIKRHSCKHNTLLILQHGVFLFVA